MNKSTIITILIILLVAIGLIWTTGSSTENDSGSATTTEQAAADASATTTGSDAEITYELQEGAYSVNTDESTVAWTARKKLVDNYEDTGTIPVSGSVTVADTGVETAELTLAVSDVAVTSVANTQAGTGRLESHLRSDDFFAVEQYPTAQLVVKNVVQIESPETMPVAGRYTITADLTMKGVTNEITFPATVGMEGDNLVVRADTQIDRSRWGIRFGSPSFFNNLGNNAISDTVDITVDLVAQANRVADQQATTTDSN